MNNLQQKEVGRLKKNEYMNSAAQYVLNSLVKQEKVLMSIFAVFWTPVG